LIVFLSFKFLLLLSLSQRPRRGETSSTYKPHVFTLSYPFSLMIEQILPTSQSKSPG